MDRAAHLLWCKHRALGYVDSGDLDNAMVSMLSGLGKHDETRRHPAKELMLRLRMGGHLTTAGEMRKFIEGFN